MKCVCVCCPPKPPPHCRRCSWRCVFVCVCRAKQSPFSLTAAEPKPKSKSTSVAKQQQFWPSSCDLLFALHYFSSSTAQSMNSNLPTCTTTRFVLVHLACLVCVLFCGSRRWFCFCCCCTLALTAQLNWCFCWKASSSFSCTLWSSWALPSSCRVLPLN